MTSSSAVDYYRASVDVGTSDTAEPPSSTQLRSLLRLVRSKGVVDARGLALSAEMVRDIIDAAPHRRGRTHLLRSTFAACAIGDGASFTNVVFHRAWFDDVQFGNEIDFSDSVFYGLVDFRGRFGHHVFFNGAQFRASVGFEGVTFGDGADFSGTSFRKTAEFGQAKFHGGALFTGVQCSGVVSFQRAQFHNQPEGGIAADFINAEFAGARFDQVRFGNWVSFSKSTFGPNSTFSEARFGVGADFVGASFGASACFDAAVLSGVDLTGVNLEGADLSGCAFDGADLHNASLAGVKLSGALLDYRTNLKGTRLFTEKSGAILLPRLVDVRWNGAQVTDVSDWPLTRDSRLGDDPCMRWPTSPRRLPQAMAKRLRLRVDRMRRSALAGLYRIPGSVRDQPNPEGGPRAPFSKEIDDLAEYRTKLADAIRAYRQTAIALQAQGMDVVAREFSYRGAQLSRQLLGRGGRFVSWCLDALTGYGLRARRILGAYVAVVFAFAVVYGATKTTSWADALWTSVIAFHGRGVISSGVLRGSFALTVPAIEAAIGLLVEGLLVAVIIRRVVRD